jgi:replication factor C subunit 1
LTSSQNGMNVNNKSLDSYVSGSKVQLHPVVLHTLLKSSKDTNSVGVAITDRTCLIMDEVDGMSAGDRGGVGALNAMIKKSRVSFDWFLDRRFI